MFILLHFAALSFDTIQENCLNTWYYFFSNFHPFSFRCSFFWHNPSKLPQYLVLFLFKFSSFFILLFFLLTQSKKIASGTPWAVECRTSTISPPTTSRSPSSSAATRTHPRRGGRDQNVEALENIFILNSLEGEWKDNKASLMEFMWAAHRGIKGMVTNHIVD